MPLWYQGDLQGCSLSLPPPLYKNENSCIKGRTRSPQKDTATHLSLFWKRSDCCTLLHICSARQKYPSQGRNIPATWLQPAREPQGVDIIHSCGSAGLAAAKPWGEDNLVDHQRPESKCLFRSQTQFSMCKTVRCELHLRGALGG